MKPYNKCPYCKSNLDPGEHCDCKQSKKETRKIVTSDIEKQTEKAHAG